MNSDFYWCEVSLTSNGRSYMLGNSLDTSSRLAVRWLRGEARRVADLMDIPPNAPWLQGISPRPLTALGDWGAAQALRIWAADELQYSEAMSTLTEGSMFQLCVHDEGLGITLSARPMPVNFVAAWRRLEFSQ